MDFRKIALRFDCRHPQASLESCFSSPSSMWDSMFIRQHPYTAAELRIGNLHRLHPSTYVQWEELLQSTSVMNFKPRWWQPYTNPPKVVSTYVPLGRVSHRTIKLNNRTQTQAPSRPRVQTDYSMCPTIHVPQFNLFSVVRPREGLNPLLPMTDSLIDRRRDQVCLLSV